jgi:hypothetical protein
MKIRKLKSFKNLGTKVKKIQEQKFQKSRNKSKKSGNKSQEWKFQKSRNKNLKIEEQKLEKSKN